MLRKYYQPYVPTKMTLPSVKNHQGWAVIATHHDPLIEALNMGHQPVTVATIKEWLSEPQQKDPPRLQHDKYTYSNLEYYRFEEGNNKEAADELMEIYSSQFFPTPEQPLSRLYRHDGYIKGVKGAWKRITEINPHDAESYVIGALWEKEVEAVQKRYPHETRKGLLKALALERLSNRRPPYMPHEFDYPPVKTSVVSDSESDPEFAAPTSSEPGGEPGETLGTTSGSDSETEDSTSETETKNPL